MKLTLLLRLISAAALAAAPQAELAATAYPAIQKAIAAYPGHVIHVPAGDYEISQALQPLTGQSRSTALTTPGQP